MSRPGGPLAAAGRELFKAASEAGRCTNCANAALWRSSVLARPTELESTEKTHPMASALTQPFARVRRPVRAVAKRASNRGALLIQSLATDSVRASLRVDDC